MTNKSEKKLEKRRKTANKIAAQELEIVQAGIVIPWTLTRRERDRQFAQAVANR